MVFEERILRVVEWFSSGEGEDVIRCELQQERRESASFLEWRNVLNGALNDFRRLCDMLEFTREHCLKCRDLVRMLDGPYSAYGISMINSLSDNPENRRQSRQ